MRTLIYPKVNPLGDSIIMILYAHMLSELTGERINVISNLFRQEKFSSIIPFGNVVYNDKDITIEYKFDKYEPVFWNFLKISENFTNTLTKQVFNQQKREPYFTYQFDAKQSYRCIKNKEKVIEYYQSQSLEPVCLDNAITKSLEEIWTLQQNAKLHVGVDSGMMHMARLVLPPEKIHMYVHFKDREDFRMPDNKNVAGLGRELLSRGVLLNPMDNLEEDVKEYYKDYSKFISYVKPSN